ncbi:hypothetical protein EJ03DRAFT_163391 [Teratosphaeria nubilosa]|uniref:Uncharacterized protein n=1 Tax=Teratosphaeria nubilosa TaxID=161662 RepID=A0A6G1L2H1_9PEZI|nr:hypothetical protein EJ03DRAFT_163391 [Teratosphaeria nubilosa]
MIIDWLQAGPDFNSMLLETFTSASMGQWGPHHVVHGIKRRNAAPVANAACPALAAVPWSPAIPDARSSGAYHGVASENNAASACINRAVAWLRQQYAPDASSEVPRVLVWNAFRAAFKYDAVTLACLRAEALFDLATKTFHGASTEQNGDKYIVRGIRQRVASHVEERAAAWLRVNYVSIASS